MKAVIAAVIAILVIGGGAFFVMNKDDAPANNAETQQSHEDGEEHDEATTQTAQEAQGATQNSENSQVASVSIESSSYTPSTVTVKKGTTVTWTNKDSIEHDVMPDSPSETFPGSNGLLSSGQTYSQTFNTAGEYTYHCTPHSFMKGKVIVTD
jgi:amicyanin